MSPLAVITNSTRGRSLPDRRNASRNSPAGRRCSYRSVPMKPPLVARMRRVVTTTNLREGATTRHAASPRRGPRLWTARARGDSHGHPGRMTASPEPEHPTVERTGVLADDPSAPRTAVEHRWAALGSLMTVSSDFLAPLVRVAPLDDGVALTHRLPAGSVSLADLRASGPLRAGHVLAVALAVAEALVDLEQHDLAHGGVRAEHVVVGPDGEVLLAGCGLDWRRTPSDTGGPRLLDDVAALGGADPGPARHRLVPVVARARGAPRVGRGQLTAAHAGRALRPAAQERARRPAARPALARQRCPAARHRVPAARQPGLTARPPVPPARASRHASSTCRRGPFGTAVLAGGTAEDRPPVRTVRAGGPRGRRSRRAHGSGPTPGPGRPATARRPGTAPPQAVLGHCAARSGHGARPARPRGRAGRGAGPGRQPSCRAGGLGHVEIRAPCRGGVTEQAHTCGHGVARGPRRVGRSTGHVRPVRVGARGGAPRAGPR